MDVQDVLAVLMVDDFPAAAAWYEQLLGRGPDRRPMETCAEWQLTGGGSIQVFRDPAHAGGGTVVLGVPDVQQAVDELADRGLVLDTFLTPDGAFRLAQVSDPAGNTVVLGQRLAG